MTVQESPKPPTAFVAWAHSDTGWTPTQREDWAETVAQFAGALTIHGIDADVDLYHLTEPGTDWTRYGPQAIRHADFVLVAVSAAWIRRFNGGEDSRVGAGASQEADALQGIYQRDRDEFRRRVMLVYLPGADTDEVPDTLRTLLHFRIEAMTRPHLDDLLRALHGQPRYVRPALGAAPDFHGAVGEGETTGGTRGELVAFRSRLTSLAAPEAAATARGIDAALDADDSDEGAIPPVPPVPPIGAGTAGAAPVRYRPQFFQPPQGHPNTWRTEPLLRLRVALSVGPATVDTVNRLGPRIHRGVIASLDASDLSRSLRTLTRQHVPVLADDETAATPGRQHLGDWQIAEADHLTGDHAAYRLGGDASSGIAGFATVSLPAYSHAGEAHLVLDIGISVADPVSILVIGRLLADALTAAVGASVALASVLPTSARVSLCGITLTAPRMADGQSRPNALDQRIDFSPMGEHTRELSMDIGVMFEPPEGFEAADRARSVVVGAIEAMMLDAGFLDPTDGIDELASRLGVPR
jgi:hypothetical protein